MTSETFLWDASDSHLAYEFRALARAMRLAADVKIEKPFYKVIVSSSKEDINALMELHKEQFPEYYE